jgi:DNA-binding transcriptional MocR family regulator
LAARLLPQLPELNSSRAGELRERLGRARELLTQHLPEWRWRTPDGGSALWIELPNTDARIFAQVALRHGVEVVPGAATDPSGAHDSHIRFPFAFPDDVLTELVHRLTRAWAEARR